MGLTYLGPQKCMEFFLTFLLTKKCKERNCNRKDFGEEVWNFVAQTSL